MDSLTYARGRATLLPISVRLLSPIRHFGCTILQQLLCYWVVCTRHKYVDIFTLAKNSKHNSCTVRNFDELHLKKFNEDMKPRKVLKVFLFFVFLFNSFFVPVSLLSPFVWCKETCWNKSLYPNFRKKIDCTYTMYLCLTN